MGFHLSETQEAIREATASICKSYGDDYWLERDEDGQFPQDFYHAFAQAG